MRLTRAKGLALAVIVGASLAACSPSGGEGLPEPTASFDAADLEQREANLADLAASLGITDRPDVDLIRFVDYLESTGAHIGCLQAAGFPVTRTMDGLGIDTSMIPAAQSKEGGPLSIALYTCNAQYTLLSDGDELLDEEGLSKLYDRYTDQEVPCLESYGIDVGDVPSRETFIDTYYTLDGWIPWTNVDMEKVPMEVYNQAIGPCSYAY